MRLPVNLIVRTWLKFRFVGQIAMIFFWSAQTVNASDAQRIISTDAGSTDVLMALKLDDSLVGVDVTSQVPASINVARLGYHRTLSAEGVLSLNPSLVIGSEHMGPPETLASIKKAGVVLVQLPVAKDDQSLKKNILTIGELVDKKAQAKDLLSRLEGSADKISQNKISADTKVAFLLQMDGRGLRMAGKGTTGHDVIALLGGENLGTHNGYQSITAEALLALAPDVIIVAGRDSETSAVNLLLRSHPLVEHTPAGQQQNIIAMDGSSIVAGISLAAIDALAEIAIQLR